MEKTKSLVLSFIILWGCIILLSMIAVVCGISNTNVGAFAVIATFISVIQTCLIGFNKKYSVIVFPLFVLLCQCLMFLPNDPMGDGKEAAVGFASLLSPFFDGVTMRILSDFSYSTRMVLLFFDCTILTMLYLFLELSLARFIILKINKLKENKE